MPDKEQKKVNRKISSCNVKDMCKVIAKVKKANVLQF